MHQTSTGYGTHQTTAAAATTTTESLLDGACDVRRCELPLENGVGIEHDDILLLGVLRADVLTAQSAHDGYVEALQHVPWRGLGRLCGRGL